MEKPKITHEFFKKISAELKLKAEKMGLSGHNPTIGAKREELLKKYFMELMPTFFNYGEGVLINSEGLTSKQEDLIIYSPFIGGFDKESSLFPIDGVCATVEIKSNLNKKSLKEAFENIKSIKQFNYSLKPKTHMGDWREKICCNIFAYNSIKIEKVKEYIMSLQKELGLKDEEMFDNLCVNGEYLFTKNKESLNHYSLNKKEKYVGLLLKDNSISYFIDLILNDTNIPLSPVPIFIKYLGEFPIECI